MQITRSRSHVACRCSGAQPARANAGAKKPAAAQFARRELLAGVASAVALAPFLKPLSALASAVSNGATVRLNGWLKWIG